MKSPRTIAVAVGRPIERQEVTRQNQTAISAPPSPLPDGYLLLELPAAGAIGGGDTKDCAYREDTRNRRVNI